MYDVLLAFRCVYLNSNERGENGEGKVGVRFLEDGRKWILPDLLYAGYLVLHGVLEEDPISHTIPFVHRQI